MTPKTEDFVVPESRSRRDMLRWGALGSVGLALSGLNVVAEANSNRSAGGSRAAGPLRSASVMTFGPPNVLIVGDIAGSAVHAFTLAPSDFTSQHDVAVGNFQNFEGADLVVGLDQKLAALLGTTYDQVVVNDMVVHEPTAQVFLAVERGRGKGATPAIVRVNHGKLEVVDLQKLPHQSIVVPNEPANQDMLEFEPQRIFAITDVKYYNGEVFVSGVSNQRFASTLYRIPYPFNKAMTTTTVEMWHPVHGEFETRAPIIRHIVREFDGEPYLFGVYGCTPLVRFPLKAFTDGAHVKGETIGEVGYGSNPLDMFTYTDPFDKKDYLLITIDVRGGARLEVADLGKAPAEPTGGPIDFGPSGLGLTKRDLPIKAEHMAVLNPKWAVAVWRHPKTSYRLDLGTVMIPYFFDRRLGMAEMNWPDGPDPFHYRDHRNMLDHA